MTKHIKIKFSIVILLALALLGGTITLAFLNKSTQAATNPFVGSEIETKINETVNINGTTISKNPSVLNKGPSPAIIRMRVTVSPNQIADLVKNPYNTDHVQDPKKPITINYDTANWTLNIDGFWYYNKVVAKGESTTPLFTTITGVTDADGKALENIKAIGDFEITLYQEAVQSEAQIDGAPVKATVDGKYNSENADKIWADYKGKAKE